MGGIIDEQAQIDDPELIARRLARAERNITKALQTINEVFKEIRADLEEVKGRVDTLERGRP